MSESSAFGLAFRPISMKFKTAADWTKTGSNKRFYFTWKSWMFRKSAYDSKRIAPISLRCWSNPLARPKNLGFIAQEMGREINTLGSKANDADMQRYVVQMKDELEKIKEQVLNAL